MVKHVHMHNIRDFPQAKLKREILKCLQVFFWNKHGDLYFLFYNLSKNGVLDNWEKN